MKKYLIIWLFALSALCGCRDNSGLYVLLNDYDYRIAALEKFCAQLNTNITALPSLIEAQQSGDYITAITPVTSGGEQIGYTITFGHGDPITIYNGKDGKDGKDGTDGSNGQDGKDGYNGQTPIIGVAQDTDGIYYWTLDGTWLLDSNGNKLRVTGQDGKDGRDGVNGKDGVDGQDGHDGRDGVDGQNGHDGIDGHDGTNGTNGENGVTPQLKIEADYWYISYDNGATWIMLGKATGENGKDGQDGKDGKDGVNGADGTNGDSMFESVTIDDDFVYFTLSNGTTITVARTNKTIIKDGAIQAEFSVSPTKKVYFSMGNLQYRASTNTWRFAEHQWDYVGDDNINMSSTYDGWIDIFPYGSSGYDNRMMPYTDTIYNNVVTVDISGTNYDWGVYNPIVNGGNQTGMWRTLTKDEWKYVQYERPNARLLKFKACVEGHYGVILLPDNWSSLYFPHYDEENNLLLSQWTVMLEAIGAVFIPYNNMVLVGDMYNERESKSSIYWSGSFASEGTSYYSGTSQYVPSTFAYAIDISYLGSYNDWVHACHSGFAVRLVQDVP